MCGNPESAFLILDDVGASSFDGGFMIPDDAGTSSFNDGALGWLAIQLKKY